ncbi:MAG: SpoIIE family protein phosphatase [Spirochaetia bacterium]|nr:SpoIIE family protein phosphatase [Spirochaetia bacterium]
MNNQNRLILNLTLRLELFTSLIPIPSFVYFIAITGAFSRPEQLMTVAICGVICGGYTVAWGIVARVRRLRAIGRDMERLEAGALSSEEKVALKLRVLHYPFQEGNTIILRWVAGHISGFALYTTILRELPLVAVVAETYALIFVLPISFVMYLYVTESAMRDLLQRPALGAIEVPSNRVRFVGSFRRILLSITSVTITPIAVFAYIFYASSYGKLSVQAPLIHILFLSAQAILSMLIVAYVVANSIKFGLSQTNQVLIGLGEGNFDVQSTRTSTDEFGEQGHLLGVVVSKLKDMYEQITALNQNLETKIEERTNELKQTLTEVQKLKVQQDGDYFLTSLLAEPLFFNANKSPVVSTDFIIRQKKSFEFKNRKAELGGDICVTGNLKLGTPENFRTYTMALNGDAMGKSMQGAGGSLVMGVVMNSIMARSAANKKVLDVTPEQWVTNVYREIDSVFRSFDGSMAISAILLLVDDLSGEVCYWSAEHPHSVLYRNGRASFLDEDAEFLPKLGFDLEATFKVRKVQLQPGDVLIMASDGRDDIHFGSQTDNGTAERIINTDETLFLKHVEAAKGSLPEIENLIRSTGELIDDLSMLRLGFHEHAAPTQSALPIDRSVGADGQKAVQDVYQKGKAFYEKGEMETALSVLHEAYKTDPNNQKLNKLLAVLSFKGKDYDTAVKVLRRYLSSEPDMPIFWYYLSVAEKKIGDIQSSLQGAHKLYDADPDNVHNLIHLADLYRNVGQRDRAWEFIRKAEAIAPGNRNVQKLKDLME